VLLQVLDQVVQVVGVCKWRLAQEWVHGKLQVILNVGNVILLQVRIGWLADEQCRILVCRRALFWGWHVFHQLVDVGHLHLLEHAAQHSAHVELVGVLVSQSQTAWF
jgi:hypothetical protein